MKDEFPYGVPVDYRKHEEIKFPDFSARFVGKRSYQQEGSQFQRDRYEFEISDGELKQTVIWIHGGLVAPTTFKFRDKEYCLLPGSIGNPEAKEETVIISLATDYWEKAKALGGNTSKR